MDDKQRMGIKNRKKGFQTEAKVRALLEADGWIVSRWNNNIDVESRTIIKATPSRFNINCGFPDFVCLKPANPPLFFIKFVESKTNGYCNPLERKKLEILSEITGCKCEVMGDEV